MVFLLWLAKLSGTKNQSPNQNQFVPAKVSSVQENQNFFVGAFEYRDVAMCMPYGFFSRPHMGQEILMLDSNKRNVTLGAISESKQMPSIKEGEVIIRSNGGAYIHLKSDGCVSVNGLLISKTGQILVNS